MASSSKTIPIEVDNISSSPKFNIFDAALEEEINNDYYKEETREFQKKARMQWEEIFDSDS